MILLWGLPGDGPLRAVYSALKSRNAPVCLFDQHSIASASLDLHVGPTVHGTLQWDGNAIALEAVSAIYARPYDVRRLPVLSEAGPSSTLWHHGMALDDGMQAWVEVTPALVVNRPSMMASNGSKPYQAELIRAAGLDVPETLVTTDVEAATAFHESHGSVIFKSTSGVRSIVSRLGPEHRDRLMDIGNCPTQFQQYVPGSDYRVHVVGDRIFGAQIVSDVDDYRYASRSGGRTEIRACTLEPELSERCRRLAADLGLLFAGIDLRRSPEGRWYCFEVNPSPGFTFYQEATGQKIADSVASLLADA